MRRCVVVLVALVLMGGQALARGTNVPTTLLPDDQLRGLEQLPEVSRISLDGNGVPTFMAGRLGLLGPGSHEGAALRFLERLQPVLRATGREEFAPQRTEVDHLGQVHVRFQQYYRGLPVIGAELIVHAKVATGEVHALSGRFAPAVDLPEIPEVDARSAIQLAAIEAGIHAGEALEEPYLVYVVENEKPYLAWTAAVWYSDEAGELIDRLFADAVTGELVARHGLIKRALNRKIYNGNHTNPDNPTLPGTFMFGEGTTSHSDAAAWDCYVNFGYTYNYFKTRFNRDSFDNAGAALIGTVHVGTNWVNAYWNGTQMVFGDGDGTTATYLSKALDVVAHELTHAVTDRTANLTYSNESGALNEAMSDIFAAGTEAYKDGGVNADTWKVGEDCWTPNTAGDALRYMNNPTADGQSYDYYPERYTGSQDYGGVHLNSGIGNLAFYLLSQGGTHPRNKTTVNVPAIGITKAEQIFYRALTVYMTSSTNFQGARNATAQAAADLYGGTSSAEYNAVQLCWNAVGVPGGPVEVITITNGQTVSGLSGSTGSWKYYKIAVPSGQTSLVVKTTGGSGDADLYVKLGGIPSTSSYNGKSDGSTATETVTISNPAAGDWYIGIYAYSTYSSVSLQATYSGSSPTLSLAVSPTSISIAQGASGTVTATTTVSGGFNSSVTFSASGLPSGASASFNPTSIAAPGAGSSTVTLNAGTAATGTYTVTITATGGGQTKTATVSLTVTSSGSGVVVITNGQTVSNISGSARTWKYYKITVPSGQTSLVVKTTGGSGDADLYVKLGGTPTTSSYNGKSDGSTSTETVTISNPAAGDWYIGLYAYSAFSGVSLQATYSASSGTTMNETESNNTTGTANTISTSGTTVTGKIGSSTDVDYFKVSLPAGRTLTLNLTVPSTKDYDLKLYNASGTQIGSSTNGTGVAERITYTNSGTSTITVYAKVYGYNGAYSTTLTYQLKATW